MLPLRFWCIQWKLATEFLDFRSPLAFGASGAQKQRQRARALAPNRRLPYLRGPWSAEELGAHHFLRVEAL